jgi:hypothetical protein
MVYVKMRLKRRAGTSLQSLFRMKKDSKALAATEEMLVWFDPNALRIVHVSKSRVR